MNQHQEWLAKAYAVAQSSPDKSTQNGSVIVDPKDGYVISTGHNDFPMGVSQDDARWERPTKYKYVEHAERNSIYRAAYAGKSVRDAVMACPWAACSDCARAIIQSGIKALVAHKQAHDRTPERWRAEIEIAHTMLDEAGVEFILYDGKIGAKSVLHNGELWSP